MPFVVVNKRICWRIECRSPTGEVCHIPLLSHLDSVSFYSISSLAISLGPAVLEDDKPPYTILCARAALDKSCSVESGGGGLGGDLREMDLIWITRPETPAVCTCRQPGLWAQRRWWVGAKMPGSSNVNYSGLGHLLCNSKMSQRYIYMLLCVSLSSNVDLHTLFLACIDATPHNLFWLNVIYLVNKQTYSGFSSALYQAGLLRFQGTF